MKENEFDKWNTIKKILDSDDASRKMVKEGSVYWVKIGLNVGSEVYGKGMNFERPVLVIKKNYINNGFCHSFIGIPLTTKVSNKHYKFYYKDREVSLMFSQVRAFDTKRIINRHGSLSAIEFDKVKKDFLEYLFPSPKLGNS